MIGAGLSGPDHWLSELIVIGLELSGSVLSFQAQNVDMNIIIMVYLLL